MKQQCTTEYPLSHVKGVHVKPVKKGVVDQKRVIITFSEKSKQCADACLSAYSQSRSWFSCRHRRDYDVSFHTVDEANEFSKLISDHKDQREWMSALNSSEATFAHPDKVDKKEMQIRAPSLSVGVLRCVLVFAH